ncbi:MAG: hypothetical protein CBE07_002605 [Pelagibacteraceae bacterium TMED247]|nr:MAG: hypothetical protein CBE07_002605 [Pelagibacteraceae bacterium TMED247]|tara:strand:- start:234 stop:1289 length:1056 start_codon:yes stop_codon:yes gene_type:complete
MKKVIFLSLIILFSIKTQNISANENIFTVDNIVVKTEISTQNRENREKYLNIGFKTGFKNLVINLLRKEDQKKILSTDLTKIKSLIENFRVIEERKLEEEYFLKISITFNKNKIKQFFYERNVPYSEISNLEILVYPIMISQNELQVFSQNKFFEEWNLNKDFENINFILPVENIEDIDFIKKNVQVLEEIDLDRLVDNYEIKNSTILILRYDKKKLNVFFKTNLNGIKKARKIEFKVDNLNNAEVRADLIRSIKFYINEVWKEENLVDISLPAHITVFTKIENAGTLKNIRSKLNNINFIESYVIEELSPNSAKIKIKYLGKIKNLQDSFFQNGFKFKIINNEWILSLSS